MKIVDRTTFLALPPNTLFSKYEPCVMHTFEIKLDTLPSDDFISQDIASAIEHDSSKSFSTLLQLSEHTGSSIAMDFDCAGRDGCFDADQLFAVWEDADVIALIAKLQLCIRETT